MEQRSFSGIGLWLLLLFIVACSLAGPLFNVRPNPVLPFLAVLALFVSRAGGFTLFAALGLLWFAYSPFFEVEYVLFASIALLFFLTARFLVFSRTLVAMFTFIVLAQALIWIVSYGIGSLLSIPFLLEFLYNAAIGIVFFSLALWLAKTSF